MVKSLCWADSTWRSRRSQWKRYRDFCAAYHLTTIPATTETVCLYITHLSYKLKFSTICNYLSAVWSMHDYFGTPATAKNSFMVRCTLKGAKRLLGDEVLSADPLLPEDIVLLYKQMDFDNLNDLVFWSALTLSYRCLLRKCHVTSSPHAVLRSDFEFTKYGACVSVRSSKTNQFRERVLQIPIIKSHGSLLCPVRWIRKYLKKVEVQPRSQLFILPRSKKPLTYSWFSSRLKKAIEDAGLKGNYSSHSLRRGCATYLARLGVPLHDIKLMGDWRSLSVLLYLAGDLNSRLVKDVAIASNLASFSG